MIEGQRRALQRHGGKRRRLDARVAVELHAACIKLGDKRLQRSRQMAAHLHGFVVDLARIAGVAGQRKRLHAVKLRRRRHRAERCVEPVHRRLMVTPIAAPVKDEARKRRRRPALTQQQPVDAQIAHLELHRQFQILRQLHRRRTRRGRRDPRVDRADVQIVDGKAPRLVAQRPASRDAVDLDVGAAAVEAAPCHLMQPQPGRDRAAVERAGQPAVEQRHGRAPCVRRAALGGQRAVQHAGRQRDEHHRHRARPHERLPRPATAARRRLRRRAGAVRPVGRNGTGRVRRGVGGSVRGHG